MMGSATASCPCSLSFSASFSPDVPRSSRSLRTHRNVEISSFAVRTGSKHQQLSVRCRCKWGQRWSSSRGNCDAVLRNDNESKLALSPSERIGNWITMPAGGATFLATTLFGCTLCDNVLAAVESVPSPESDINLMIIIACVAEAVALTGAVVGGILARQRKVELEKINAQLRQINLNLRRQTRVESYAPNLTYAPVGSGRMIDTQVREDPMREQLMQFLKAGKRWLREQNPAKAFSEFEKALPIAKQLKDTVEEKKTARGLGASCQRLGRYKDAIKYHTMVLTISHMTRERAGNTEAYGAIADCYTEIGDLETAAKFYDKYIDNLEKDE